VLPFPLNRCDVQEFNGIIKQEIIIGDQVFTEIVKQENTEETDHNNYSQLLQNIWYELNLYHSNSVISNLILQFLL